MSRRPSTPVACRVPLAWVIGVAGAIAGGFIGLVWMLSTELAAPAAALGPQRPAERPPPRFFQSLPTTDAVVGEACEHPARFGPDGAADELAQHLSRREWSAAADLIGHFPDVEDRLTAWSLLLEAWAEAEPAAALHYVQARLAPPERRAALAAVVHGWAQHDQANAGAWLSAQPPSAENDAAFATLAVNPAIPETQPLLALGWVGQVTDRALRWETTRAVVQRWAQRDEFAARDYASRAADLTAEQRAQLLQRVAQRTALLD